MPNYGVYSGGGCYGYGMPQVIMPPVTSGSPPMAEPIPAVPAVEPTPIKEKEKGKEGTMAPADKAAVVVRLPADAKLYADGQLTALTTAERRFYTPTLDQNREYNYTMKVEYTRNGETVRDTKTVQVRAGEVSVVEFTDLSRVAKKESNRETATSKVTVMLPADAKLFVDGQEAALAKGVREFTTPALPKGEEFSYTFRAAVERNGEVVEKTRRVTFLAGETVKVEFNDMGTLTVAK